LEELGTDAGVAPPSDSTVKALLEQQRDLDGQLRQLRRRRLGRRVALVLLGLIVLAAVAGLFGQRTRHVAATAGGYALAVRYPSVVRDGPPTSLEISIQRASGFDGSVEVAIDAAYLSAFEQPDVSPRPEAERSVGDLVVWSFSQPEGDQLTVQLEAQMSSQVHFGQHGHIGIREHGATVVEVGFTTWVWP
jgi:hypothetical protein